MRTARSVNCNCINLRSLSVMLDYLGLKAVPQEMQCYRPEDIDPYIQLARRHFEHVQSARDLIYEDDPTRYSPPCATTRSAAMA